MITLRVTIQVPKLEKLMLDYRFQKLKGLYDGFSFKGRNIDEVDNT